MDRTKQDLVENLDKYKLGLDDKFRFKCLGCGKCCKNRNDILLTTRDIHRIAVKLGMTMRSVLDTYCEAYVGRDSRIPIVRLRPADNNNCPLLKATRCAVHDAKPFVCALFPLGRVSVPNREETSGLVSETGLTYIMQPVECGSRTRSYTVRAWLEKFGIPVEDEFYTLWNETVVFLVELFRGLEVKHTPQDVMEAYRAIAFSALYAAYDTGVELLPQFRENANELRKAITMMTGGGE